MASSRRSGQPTAKKPVVANPTWVELAFARVPRLTIRATVALCILALIGWYGLDYAKFRYKEGPRPAAAEVPRVTIGDHPVITTNAPVGGDLVAGNKTTTTIDQRPRFQDRRYVIGDGSNSVISIAKNRNGSGAHFAMQAFKDFANPNISNKEIMDRPRQLQAAQYWVNSGTEVEEIPDPDELSDKVIEEVPIVGGSLTHVRILEGKYIGKTGWVHTSLLKTRQTYKVE